MTKNSVRSVITGELEVRSAQTGPICLVRSGQPSTATESMEVRLDQGMYAIIERTVPVMYGGELLYQQRATLLSSRLLSGDRSREDVLATSDVIALEVEDDHDHFVVRYCVSPIEELRKLSAIRHDAIADVKPGPGECRVGGALVASRDRCLLASNYPTEPGQPAALLDHDIWFPVLNRHIPANGQPAWPVLVIPAVIHGILATDDTQSHWRFTDVISITIQRPRCLIRISLDEHRNEFIYKDLL